VATAVPAAPDPAAPLRALRARLDAEREALLAVCARVRTEITVLRLSTPRPEPGEIALVLGELLAHLQEVGTAVRGGVESPR
jgi:hypothetical protein